MSKAIERQVITTWHKPEEQMPEEHYFIVTTISLKTDTITYDHALCIANYANDGEGYNGWIFDDPIANRYADKVTIHAWCDLEPYGGGA